MDLAKFKADFPDLYAQVVQIGRDQASAETTKAVETARDEGVQAERTRVVGILGVEMKGFEKAKVKAIEDGSTVEQFAVSIVQGKVTPESPPSPPKEDPKAKAQKDLYGESPKVKVGADAKELDDAEIQAAIDVAVAAANKS